MTQAVTDFAPRVVLVGAGHAHLDALQRTREFTRRGFAVTLIAPDEFWYSGLATGMLGGLYSPELDQVDVGRLVAAGGGKFLRDQVTHVDVAARTVHRQQGEPVRYDVLSLNLGSHVPLDRIAGAADFGYPVKPIRNLWRLRQDLEQRWANPNLGDAVRVVVAGGGPTACEIATNVVRLANARQGRIHVRMLAAGKQLLPNLPRRAARQVERLLQRQGVDVRLGSRVASVAANTVSTTAGEPVPYDVLIYAIGLKPHPLIRRLGLPTDDEGSLIVNKHLASVADGRVFGGGDCVDVEGRALAKIGVYAVRESSVLTHNLLATLEGRPLERFEPQRRFLLILNLGDGTGLATWGPLHWHSRWAFRWKDWIDRRFLAKYQPAQD